MTVVCGDHPEVRKWLSDFGADVLTATGSGMLPAQTANHADMLCFSCGKGRGYTYDVSLCAELCARGYDFRVPEDPLGAEYPQDIKLNCLVIGRYIVANEKHIAPEIREWTQRSGIEMLSVRQGYARCSTLAVTSGAAITADRGIAAVLRQCGVDVLEITPGHIRLDGYDYGFIGGASAVFGDTVLFCGDPYTHPCGRDIVRFIERHGAHVETTARHELLDFGSCVTVS